MKEQVKEYVYLNYKTYKDKTLLIEEFDSHYTVRVNTDESPLILGKGII